MDLRQLRYFVAVAEALSFTRAAERLHMAQPPLSTQMKNLETELGVQLFDRSRRAITLTQAGEALLPEAKRLLNQVSDLAALVRRVGQGAVGRLTIGFTPAASNNVLPPLLRAFSSQYPEVELYLREQTPEVIVRELLADRIDLGFMYLPIQEAALEYSVVSSEPFLAVLPQNHRLASRTAIRLTELRDEPFLLPAGYGAGLHEEVLRVCRRAGFFPVHTKMEVWLMQSIVGLVAAGIGVALEPSSARNLHRTGVVYVPLKDTTRVDLAATWLRRSSRPVLKAFLGVLSRGLNAS